MPYIPLVSRLKFKEFLFIIISIVILVLERVVRIFNAAFPSISAFIAKRILKLTSADLSSSSVHPVAKMQHINDMVSYWGFPFEEHLVVSENYYLGLHRIPHAPSEPFVNGSTSSLSNAVHGDPRPLLNGIESGPPSTPPTPRLPSLKTTHTRPAVLLGHGFMMCSEVWVCSRHNSLAFMLSEEGYDVWMMNARGNKYSFKHKYYSPDSVEFWNFSLDEYAQDLVNVVDYILELTNQTSLIYIGFSQGTAQLFAALSTFPKLNNKIRLACCLAPTGKPKNLRNSFVSSLIQSTPYLLYLIFGRKAALAWVPYLTHSFSPKTWVYLIDFSLRFLFNWKCDQISFQEKMTCYRHLYSTASVKSIVHWFQIIRSSNFSMYDDALGFNKFSSFTTHVPPSYPIKNIATKLALFYGKADTLSDIHFLLDSLHPIYSLGVPSYEHLDCLWASNAHQHLFPGVIGVLRKFGGKHPDGSNAFVPLPYLPKELVESVLASGTTAPLTEEEEEELELRKEKLQPNDTLYLSPIYNGPVDRKRSNSFGRGHGSTFMDNQRATSKSSLTRSLI